MLNSTMIIEFVSAGICLIATAISLNLSFFEKKYAHIKYLAAGLVIFSTSRYLADGEFTSEFTSPAIGTACLNIAILIYSVKEMKRNTGKPESDTSMAFFAPDLWKFSIGCLSKFFCIACARENRKILLLAAALIFFGLTDLNQFPNLPSGAHQMMDLAGSAFVLLYCMVFSKNCYEMKISLPVFVVPALIQILFMSILRFGIDAISENRFIMLLHELPIIFTIILTGFTGHAAGSRIADGLRNIVDGTDEIIRGNLEHRIETGDDELISKLAGCFNTMANALKIARKELSGALNKSRNLRVLKEEFIRNISHELRTPLTVIISNLGMLKHRMKNENNIEYIDTAVRESKKMHQLVSLLLEYSRLRAGEIEPHIAEFDVRRCVENTLVQKDLLNFQKEIQLVNEVLSITAMGDFELTSKALFQILKNAFEYSPEQGTVKIKVKLKKNERNCEEINLIVTDQGQGINIKSLEEIFDEFQQEDGSATRKHGGAGLGLAYAKNLMLIQGGGIDVQSNSSGQGSSFRIILPAA